MKLRKLYSLRTDFTIIGLTGRVGSGCTEIANTISQIDFIEKISPQNHLGTSLTDNLKFTICYNYLKPEGNWTPYKIIDYRNVLLLHLLHETSKTENPVDTFLEIVFQNGKSNNTRKLKNRFDKKDDSELFTKLSEFLQKFNNIFSEIKLLGNDLLNNCLKSCLKEISKKTVITDFFFGNDFETFAIQLYDLLNKYNITKRTRLFHDLANNLRSYGTVKTITKVENDDFENIYIVAETINRIIKAWRDNNNSCKIVIDALKNSLELMFFKEKFSAFYMVATNKQDSTRRDFIIDKITRKYGQEVSDKHAKEILNLDDTEYKSNDYKKGKFSTPDIENCIQKSDYHLFMNKSPELKEHYLSIEHQLIKLLALINQPGIITPTGIERTMQVAYNAKFNWLYIKASWCRSNR